jgi:hypothetical protein
MCRDAVGFKRFDGDVRKPQSNEIPPVFVGSLKSGEIKKNTQLNASLTFDGLF